MMSGIVQKRDLVFRMKGVGTMFTLRDVKVPDELYDRKCYSSRIRISNNQGDVFRGYADLCVEPEQLAVIRRIDRMFVLCVRDEDIFDLVEGSEVKIENVEDEVTGERIWDSYNKPIRDRR